MGWWSQTIQNFLIRKEWGIQIRCRGRGVTVFQSCFLFERVKKLDCCPSSVRSPLSTHYPCTLKWLEQFQCNYCQKSHANVTKCSIDATQSSSQNSHIFIALATIIKRRIMTHHGYPMSPVRVPCNTFASLVCFRSPRLLVGGESRPRAVLHLAYLTLPRTAFTSEFRCSCMDNLTNILHTWLRLSSSCSLLSSWPKDI